MEIARVGRTSKGGWGETAARRTRFRGRLSETPLDTLSRYCGSSGHVAVHIC
jgi:hypothetical protein